MTSSTGYIVTAGHCADSTDESNDFVPSALQHMVDVNEITQDAANIWKQSATTTSPSSGKPGVDLTLSAYLPSSSTGSKVKVPATIVEDLPTTRGDVALLQVQPSAPLTALQLAKNEPVNGDGVTVCGFPGTVADLTAAATIDPNQAPSLKTGHVSAIQPLQFTGGIPFIQTDAAISAGMSGGPMVDGQGDVVGVVSGNPKDETQAFNFGADLSTIQALVARHAASTPPTAADQALRNGLAAFYSADYHAAVGDFDSVLREQPENTTAQGLRAKALSIDPNAASLFGIAPALLWGAALGIVVVLAIGAWWIVRRRRSRNLGPETFTVPSSASEPPNGTRPSSASDEFDSSSTFIPSSRTAPDNTTPEPATSVPDTEGRRSGDASGSKASDEAEWWK